MVNCLKVCAGLFGPVAWLMQVISLATTSWATAGTITKGLFIHCVSIFCTGAKYTNGNGGLIWAAAGIMALGVGATGLGILIGWGSCCCCGRNVKVAIASGVFYNIGAFLSLLAAIIFAAGYGKEFGDGYSLGFSWVLALIGMILSVVSSIFIIIGGKKEAAEPLMVVAPAGMVVMQQQPVMMQQPMQ